MTRIHRYYHDSKHLNTYAQKEYIEMFLIYTKTPHTLSIFARQMVIHFGGLI